MPKNRFELKTGIQAELAKNWTIWGAVAMQSGQNHFSDINGTFGARYLW
ncbi:autotransporter outer membrane beta-barrel domain-containing protein [Serratia sp. (in: enterobacteria)]